MNQPSYQVNEIFTSLQGEGYWTGTRATFIRLQGCTVGCPWCDSGPLADRIWGRQTNGMTRNTWGKGGDRMTVNEIVSKIDARHIVITGGEPTMYNLDPLIKAIWSGRQTAPYIQLETSGQNWLKGLIKPNWITWSPKQQLGWDIEVPPAFLEASNEVKFVVDEHLTTEVVMRVLDRVFRAIRVAPIEVSFMPEGCPSDSINQGRAMDLVAMVEHLNPGHVRFSDRMQYRLGIR